LINESKQEIDKNKDQLFRVEHDVELLKIELKAKKLEQVQHYQSVLKRGLDARKDGLIWVIKCIWLLGEDVNIVHMPVFLDS